VGSVATILVVDDQSALRDNVKQTLEEAGYQVLTAADGVEALNILQAQPMDLVLADIAMPRMNGYELYERVRRNPQWIKVPFIFLTARTLDSDIRYGKQLGVDDYLVKPFQLEDLLATVEGKLRHARQLAQLESHVESRQSLEQHVLTIGRLIIDSDQYRVWLDGRPVRLSAKEFALLEYLARRAGKLVPPRELIRITHKLDTDDQEAGTLLRPLVRSLRRKLGYRAGEMGCIETVRSVGYQLIAPE
jgi:two-component system response regulator VanR